jgi:nucleotide-binding universal stress UspA family protein
MPGIVVGVDGSEHSQRSLEWAMNEAALRHAPLIVLAVHPVTVSACAQAPVVVPQDEADEECARAAAQEGADKAAAPLGERAPAVSVRSVCGSPAAELIKAGTGADLLVVGARGSGGFARLLMGSVSAQVMHHAPCPVVVIPGVADS